MRRVIVAEYAYDPSRDEETRAREEKHLAACLRVREARRIRACVSADGKRGFSVFEAADAEAVRNAHRSAGVPFSSVWPADETT